MASSQRRLSLSPRTGRRPQGAAARYRPSRMGALYEVSKLLTHFVETVEQTILTLIAVVAKELPIQSLILIEKGAGAPEVVIWHAPEAAAADRMAAEALARRTFALLTGEVPPPAETDDAQPSPSAAAAVPARRGRFITFPLGLQGQPVAGVLHLEGQAPFNEEDVEFVSAIGNQLAGALDRYRAHLREIDLRKKAQASARHLEREAAGRRRVEAEVRALNEHLERRVAERTSQFQDTIKELHAFTYSVAHDLRAPLRHVHGFSQLLIGSADTEAAKDYARRIMAASAGMDQLIKDLLTYSRLTLEEVPLEPVSLSEVVAKIQATLSVSLQEQKAQLVVQEPLPRVMAHQPALIQAITNLISNGVKFVAPGVVPLIVVRGESRGRNARLWVEDNGIGIAAEHQERIFGVFQRLHRSEDYPGTGIGLALVHRALERMKGKSGVESTLGQGSRFWIELPTAGD